MERIEVAAGVLRDDRGRFLICRRKGKLDGLWEFPGGKREAGESYQQCLERELLEELSLPVRAGSVLWETEETYGDRVIHLAFVGAEPVGAGEVTLSVHGKAAWVEKGDLARYAFCDADAAFVREIGAGQGTQRDV